MTGPAPPPPKPICAATSLRASLETLSMPSLLSALPRGTPKCFCSKRRPASSSIVAAARRAALAWRSAKPDFDAIFSASLRVFRHQLVGCDDLVDEAPFVAVFGVEHVAGHDQFAGARMADPMRKTLGTAKARNNA